MAIVAPSIRGFKPRHSPNDVVRLILIPTTLKMRKVLLDCPKPTVGQAPMNDLAAELSDTELLSLADGAREQMLFARGYLHTLVDTVPVERWFEQPAGCPTHVAWQVGHIASSQYLLTLFRTRGKLDSDEGLIPKAFLKQFGKGSEAQPAEASSFSAGQVLEIFDAVGREAVAVVPTLSANSLRQSVVMPYAVYPNILGSLLLASHHEMLHAGQVGIVRRMLGLTPVR